MDSLEKGQWKINKDSDLSPDASNGFSVCGKPDQDGSRSALCLGCVQFESRPGPSIILTEFISRFSASKKNG
jgi:hypothetical protein